MYDISSKVKFMNAMSEASFLVRQVAEPRPVGDSVKAAIQRAHIRLKEWPYGRVRALWYADSRITVSADEMEKLRQIAKAKAQETPRDPEIQELRAQLQLINHRLARLDPEFHAPTIEKYREMAYAQIRPVVGSSGMAGRNDCEEGEVK